MNGLRWKMACAGLVCAAGLVNGRGGGGPEFRRASHEYGDGDGDAALGDFDHADSARHADANPGVLERRGEFGIRCGWIARSGQHLRQSLCGPVLLWQSDAERSSSLGTAASSATSTSGSTTSSTTTSTARGGGGLGAMQMGLMMMATQNPNGVGSGAVERRPEQPDAVARPRPTAQPTARTHFTSSPAGLAAHYFNRGGVRSAIPQSYYNRQTRYFPINCSNGGDLRSFDLSERAIVPILSLVKMDPPGNGLGPENWECQRRGTGRVPCELDCP